MSSYYWLGYVGHYIYLVLFELWRLICQCAYLALIIDLSISVQAGLAASTRDAFSVQDTPKILEVCRVFVLVYLMGRLSFCMDMLCLLVYGLSSTLS